MGESSATMGQEGDCALNPLRTCGGAMEQKLEGDRALNPLREGVKKKSIFLGKSL